MSFPFFMFQCGHFLSLSHCQRDYSSISLLRNHRTVYRIFNLSYDKDHVCRPFILAAVYQLQTGSCCRLLGCSRSVVHKNAAHFFDQVLQPAEKLNNVTMGVAMIFSRGRKGIFPKFFLRGLKMATFVFSHSKLRKQPFFAVIFKI